MSRIGKKPVPIPDGVEVSVTGRVVTVKGPKGTLTQEITGAIQVAVEKEPPQVVVTRGNNARSEKSLHGLYRTLINNMIAGVVNGYSKTLKIIGTGYRADKQGKVLKLVVGLNSQRPEEVTEPEGVTIEVPDPNTIIVKGIDKQAVGQTAATIRAVRKPEHYKGKGIRYLDEYVRILPGKSHVGGK